MAKNKDKFRFRLHDDVDFEYERRQARERNRAAIRDARRFRQSERDTAWDVTLNG